MKYTDFSFHLRVFFSFLGGGGAHGMWKLQGEGNPHYSFNLSHSRDNVRPLKCCATGEFLQAIRKDYSLLCGRQ